MQNNKENNMGRQNTLVQAMNDAAFCLLNADIDTFEENLFQAMGIMAEAACVDRMYIWRNHTIEGRLYATQVYEWSEEAEPQQANELTVDISYDEIMTGLEELLSGGGCVNNIVSEMLPEHQEHLVPQGILSILIVPVFLQEGFWGFVGFDDCQKERLFTDSEESVLRSSSLLFAHAYNKNAISRQIAEQNEFNKVMFNSAPIGLSVFDGECELIDCNDAILGMYDDMTKEFYLNNFFGLSPEYQLDGMKSIDKMRENIKCALNGEDVKMEWLHRSPDSELIPCEVTITRVKSRDEYRAIAYTYDLRRVKSLEAELGAVKHQVYLDQLTGIFNRRYFDESLAHIISLLSRSDTTLSLLLLDIDYFKLYNDTYGHQSGDDCLKQVAVILTKSVSRAEDFVARYGGEEFVVVLPNTDEYGARLIAESILKNIRKANIAHETSKIANHITVSIGGVSGPVDYTKTKDDYIKLADKMLYASKQKGRDRYSFQS